MTDSLNRQLLRLTALLQLERRARRAENPEALGFIIVNETFAVVPYRQAILWSCPQRSGRGRVMAVSGVSVPDPDGPFLQWLGRLLPVLAEGSKGHPLKTFGPADVPPDAARDWREWLPPHALWVNLGGGDGRVRGGLLLVRAEPWTAHDERLFDYLGEAYGHALEAVLARCRRRDWIGRGWTGRGWAGVRAAVGVALLLLVSAVPVRESALAPAEVVAQDPLLVRATYDGVVEDVHVDPNQTVAAGQLLVSLDPTDLRSRHAVAVQAKLVAEAEYRKAAQMSVFDAKAKAGLPVLEGRIQERAAEIDRIGQILDRLQLRAPAGGIALFDDRNDWRGRPVRIGERIMEIADPRQVELELRLPVEDAIPVAPGADVRLFLNLRPEKPVPATLRRIGYRAAAGPDGILAYRLVAAFPDGEAPPQVGLRGTAKLYGDTVPLGFFVLRRPIGVVRSWLGV